MVNVYVRLKQKLLDKLWVSEAKERASRMEHCSYRHSDFYQLITLLMSSIESYLSNKPKQVFFNPIHIFDTFTHSITLLYIFNKLFSFNVNFLIYTTVINIVRKTCFVVFQRFMLSYTNHVAVIRWHYNGERFINY